MSVNEYADLTSEEYLSKFASQLQVPTHLLEEEKILTRGRQLGAPRFDKVDGSLAKEVNWAAGEETMIEGAAQGVSWAVAAVSALEALAVISG